MAGHAAPLGTIMPKDLYLMASFNRDRNELNGPLQGLNILGVVTMEGNTVLHIAASRGNSDLIKVVVNQHQLGGNILQLLSSTNTAGDIPLHCAARAGHHDSVQVIIAGLQNMSDLITTRNNAGDNALHLAARHGHHQVVQTLMATAPPLSYVLNGAGTSALYLAVMSGSLASARAILQPNAANILHAAGVGPNLQNALHAAVLQSHEMAAEVLTWMPNLAMGTDMSNSTPLHFAASDGSSTIVRRILSAKEVNPAVVVAKRDKDGRSALHAAARNGHADVVRLLIDRCPHVAEIRDNEGKTFLHAASEGDNLARIRKIVSYVLQTPMLDDLLNAQDNQGNTPLHLLILNRNDGYTVQKLLSVGKVQVNIMNNDGHTALDLVKSSPDSVFFMISLVVILSIYGARFKPQRQDKVTKWDNAKLTSWRHKTSKNLSLVSTLVATIAFACLFNVPGSYGADGKANLDGNRMYIAFGILDTIAVVTSVMATVLLVHGTATSAGSWLSFAISLHCLWVSVLSLFVACLAAMRAVTKKTTTSYVQVITGGTTLLIDMLLLFASPAPGISLVRFLLRGRTSGKRIVDKHVTRHFPIAGFFVFNLLVFVIINLLALFALCSAALWGISASEIKS